MDNNLQYSELTTTTTHAPAHPPTTTDGASSGESYIYTRCMDVPIRNSVHRIGQVREAQEP